MIPTKPEPSAPKEVFQGRAVIKNVANDYVSQAITAQPNFRDIFGTYDLQSKKWQRTLMGYFYAQMLDGTITLSSRVRILTNDRKVEIYDGSIFSLIKINDNVQTLVNRIDYDETDDVKETDPVKAIGSYVAAIATMARGGNKKTSDKKGGNKFLIHLDKMPVLHSGCIIEAYTAE